MLLIITHKTDYTADFVINKLNERQIKYRRFNCEDVLKYDCSIRFNADLIYSIIGEHSIKSIWFRRTQLPSIEGLPINEKVYILNEIDSLISNLFSIIDAKWMSDPFAVYKAENKLFQLKVANAIGFNIPRTIVTNSKQELSLFYEENSNRIILKPISQTRIDSNKSPYFIFTNRVSQEKIDSLENFDLTPCIYQQEIEKEYEVRVTVVGEKVFSAAIDSQSDEDTKIDWRKKKLKFIAVNIPENVKALCVKIVKELNLLFGAIDLIKSKDGGYVFLEINPNGQWAWIESQTGLGISDAIIEELINI